MNVIYKYEIAISDFITLELPVGAKILCFKTCKRTNKPCIWVMLDPNEEKEARRFAIAGTGILIDFNGEYIDTLQTEYFVWHLFEIGK